MGVVSHHISCRDIPNQHIIDCDIGQTLIAYIIMLQYCNITETLMTQD